MEEARLYGCQQCGYEFLAKGTAPSCPRCKSTKLDRKDIKALVGIDD